MKSQKILVSVCCVTYNHEKYIRQCLDGFVMQKTDFEFEILVHDDASTDNTANIVKEYEQKFPSLFRCVYQSENQFLKQNTLVNILFKMAKGKYIALCEGDDYWTDPYKLQKQVDFLEGNKEYSATFHNVEQRWEGVEKSRIYLKENEYSVGQVVSLKNTLGHNIVPTCSLLFRRQLVLDSFSIIPWAKLDYGDWVIVLLLTLENSMFYSPYIMGVRRMNDSSFWGMKDVNWQIEKTLNTRNIIFSLDILSLSEKEMLKVYNNQLLLKYHNVQPSKFLIIIKKVLQLLIKKVDNLIDKYLIKKLRIIIRM